MQRPSRLSLAPGGRRPSARSQSSSGFGRSSHDSKLCYYVSGRDITDERRYREPDLELWRDITNMEGVVNYVGDSLAFRSRRYQMFDASPADAHYQLCGDQEAVFAGGGGAPCAARTCGQGSSNWGGSLHCCDMSSPPPTAPLCGGGASGGFGHRSHSHASAYPGVGSCSAHSAGGYCCCCCCSNTPSPRRDTPIETAPPKGWLGGTNDRYACSAGMCPPAAPLPDCWGVPPGFAGAGLPPGPGSSGGATQSQPCCQSSPPLPRCPSPPQPFPACRAPEQRPLYPTYACAELASRHRVFGSLPHAFAPTSAEADDVLSDCNGSDDTELFRH